MRSLFQPLSLALVVVGAGAALLLAPTVAHACSVGPHVVDGYPTAGAVDVPLDVVPWVVGAGFEWQSITLEDASGNVVAVDVTSQPSNAIADFYEIRARAPLSPSTTYTLALGPPDGLWMNPSARLRTFTTGVASSGPPPAIPSIGTVTRVEPEGSDSCGYRHFFCASVHVDPGVQYELHVLDGAGAILGVYLGMGPVESLSGWHFPGPAARFALHTRAPNGDRSPPDVTDATAMTYYRTTEEPPGPYSCGGGGRVSPGPSAEIDGGAGSDAGDAGVGSIAGGGCAVISSRVGAHSTAWLWLLLGAFAVRRSGRA